MPERFPSRLLKITTFRINATGNYERNAQILNHDGTPMNVFQAPMIQALARGLGVTFNIVIPEDNMLGDYKHDGRSTGLVGMMHRGEADLSVSGFTMTKVLRGILNFTYPLYVTDTTFATDNPVPQPKSFAIFDVFSFKVWIGIGICIILLTHFFYYLLKKRERYSTILFDNIGSLVGQSYYFPARQKNSALMLLHWLIGISILTASYKAVILSVITVPKMVGIRDLKDLANAAKESSIKCFSWKGERLATQLSQYDSYKVIGESINKSNIEGLYDGEAFLKFPYRKAFLAERIEMIFLRPHYLISDDSLHISYIGIPYSKNFCCPRKLERVVHRINAAGLYEKALRDQSYIAQMTRRKELGLAKDGANIEPLKLKDFTGAFTVLIVGQMCSLLVFIAEIVSKKNFINAFLAKRKKNAMIGTIEL